MPQTEQGKKLENVQSINDAQTALGQPISTEQMKQIIIAQSQGTLDTLDVSTPDVLTTQDLEKPKTPVVPPNTPLDTAGSLVSGTQQLLKEYNEPTPEETKRKDLTNQLTTDLETVTGKGDSLIAEENRLGVPQDIKRLKDLNVQIAQASSEFDKMEEQLSAGTGLTTTIAGKTGQLRRQKAVEIGGLATMAQALQGNIQLAQSTAERTVNLQYAEEEQRIENTKTLLDLNYQDLTRAEKKKADILSAKLTEQQNKINDEKEVKKNISSVMIEAAKNGADQTVLNKIKNSTSLMDAIQNAGNSLSTQEGTSESWSTFTNADGETMLYDKNTGTTKPVTVNSTTGDIDSDYFTDANGVNWNITGWATDPTKTQQMQTIANQIGKVDDSNIEAKVKQFTPGITADMIRNTSAKTGVSWEALMTMINQESTGGTSWLAKNDNNFGGLTFNNQEWIKDYGGTKGSARPAAEGGNYINFPTKQSGLDAMGALMANYGTVNTTKPANTEVDFYVKQYNEGKLTTAQVLDKIKPTLRKDFMESVVTTPSMTDSTEELAAKDKVNLIDSIIKSPGLNSAVGPTWLSRTAVLDLGGAKDQFIGSVQQLVSQDTLDTLLALKKGGGTLGALSDQERIMLQTAATKVGNWAISKNGRITGYDIDEKSFKAEMQRMKELAQRAITNSIMSGVQTMNDGTTWKQNADGTYTQI